MEAHPLCLVLPEMTRAEFDGLRADIKAKGLMHPITTYEGKVLDGRHRLRACEEAGIEPRFVEYAGNDPAGFVASTCQHRSLNASQRALIAAGFLAYEQEQAKRRQLATQNNKASKAVQEDFPEQMKGQARDKAGERMHVSGRTVEDAAKVLTKAAPEVVEKVRSGEMALNEAKKVVHLNQDAQRRIVEGETKQARREALREAVNRSEAAKRRQDKTPIASEPGTPYVRKLLSAVERIGMMCAEEGLKEPGAIASKFLDEMDWNAGALTLQFERCDPVIRALTIIRERQSVAAKAA